MSFEPSVARKSLRVVGMICLLALGGAPLALGGPGGTQNPGIAPIQSHPHGKSYAAWATSW